MKKWIDRVFAVVGSLALAAAITALLVFGTGCATSHQRAAYQTTAITGATVQLAMGVWREHVNAGNATDYQVAVVREAYNDWRTAYLLAVDIGEQTAVDNTASKDKYAVALEILASTQDRLVTLVRRLLPAEQRALVPANGGL